MRVRKFAYICTISNYINKDNPFIQTIYKAYCTISNYKVMVLVAPQKETCKTLSLNKLQRFFF